MITHLKLDNIIKLKGKHWVVGYLFVRLFQPFQDIRIDYNPDIVGFKLAFANIVILPVKSATSGKIKSKAPPAVGFTTRPTTLPIIKPTTSTETTLLVEPGVLLFDDCETLCYLTVLFISFSVTFALLLLTCCIVHFLCPKLFISIAEVGRKREYSQSDQILIRPRASSLDDNSISNYDLYS